jgi:ferredoxin
MSALPHNIQEQIKSWLASGEIELFIGWEQGPVPLRATPTFVRGADDVSRLIWDATCENNLTAYLARYKGHKVGLMVKGCDARAIIGLMQEGQWQRDNLRIVGVSCPGVIDVRKVAQATGQTVDDLDRATLENEAVTVGDRTLALDHVLYDMCTVCDRHNPNIEDAHMGTPIADAQVADRFAHVHAMEALSENERWARVTAELSRCNLCFACRNACPLCYCTICFADRTQPQWLTSSSEPADIQFFQIIRTFHLAGRCVGCGACTRACPQGVNLRLLLDKLRLDAAELFDYQAGVDPEAQPPLRTYRQDDPNDIFM